MLAEMPDQVTFQSVSGDAAGRIASHPWHLHPLGSPATWPAALKVGLGTALRSPEAMFIAWGPDLFSFFNDAYGEILGAKIDSAIGRPFAELWSDVWDDIAPIVDKALAGVPSRFVDMPLTMTRNGVPEETWWTFSYSPLIDESGAIAGMLCVTNETTSQVLNGRRQAFRTRLDDALRPLNEPLAIKATANAMLGEELQAGAVGYGDALDDRCERTLIEQDWVAPGFPSAAGLHVLEDYGVATRADLKAGRIIRIDDTATDPATGPQTSEAFAQIGTRAYINVPLVKDGRFVALQYILNPAPRRWTDQEVALAAEVAERTWSAVERAHAEIAMREDRRSLTALNSAAASMAGELDLDRLVQTVTDAGVALTGAQFGAFFYNVENPQGESYMLYTLSGVDRSKFDKFPMPRNTAVFAPTFGGEGVVRSADILQDERYGHNTPNRGMPTGHLPVRSYLAAPVTSRSGEVIGGLFFGHSDPGRFDAQHEASIVAIAAQAAIAIDNSRLFAEAKRDLEERRAAEMQLKELNDTLEQRIEQATAEREKVEEALRQAQKMEAVGQLTGGLAHDFNNLLTGMMGNLELLQVRVARGRLDDLDRFINAAQGAGRRAASLTQRLLAFSRRQTLDPKPTDVNRLIAALQELLHRTVGATVDIEVVGAAGLWAVDIDAAQLENAILNLCINGRDAMPEGGKLTIETANKWLDDRMGRERDLPPGQYVSICVTDTGTGMSAATIARAFEPFYTTKPIGQGTGLGLSMIYGFAKQSGGQVRIYSEVGQGTTVCIYLPRHHGDAEKPIEGDASALAENVSANAQTVLVVDDEATIRHLIDEVLDDLGYTVIGAADGAAGIKVLQSGAKIDLLITDVGLPNGMNGRQVADAARALRPGLKVLFITGFAENAAVGNGHLEPGMELLTKPFTLEALSGKVAEMLKPPH